MVDLIVGADEVQQALEEERAVVALETTLVAHGFPVPEGIAVALASEAAVRAAGAVPATVGVLDGYAHTIRSFLAERQPESFYRKRPKGWFRAAFRGHRRSRPTARLGGRGASRARAGARPRGPRSAGSWSRRAA